MIVVTIVGILATLAVPSYHAAIIKAKEGALRQDLFSLRDVIDQHRADKGKYPRDYSVPDLGRLSSACSGRSDHRSYVHMARDGR